jgi:hypothetical protein
MTTKMKKNIFYQTSTSNCWSFHCLVIVHVTFQPEQNKTFFFLCIHYDWISRIKYIIGTLCYQNNKGNNKWKEQKKKRYIHISSFCYRHTHVDEKKTCRKKSCFVSCLFYTQTHIHNLIRKFFFYPAASNKEKKKRHIFFE